MPTYVYEIISTGERFEVIQGMDEPSIVKHPESGEPVKKVFLPPHLGIKHTAGTSQKLLDNKNIEQAGFTKYEKDKLTGQYHKVVGKEGPKIF